MRRKKAQPHDNHERWLVSYADFVTLLFAFFVVMFATSQVNKKRVASIAEAYSAYLSGDPIASSSSIPSAEPQESLEVMPISDKDARRMLTAAEMLPVMNQVEERLAALIESKEIAVSLQGRGLVLSLREAAFFDPGHETFRIGAVQLLAQIGGAIQEVAYQPIRLEGHTDNVPIRTEKFPSNWELSSARAIEALDFLTTRFDLPGDRLSVAGYGEHHPVASNDSAEGRAANRRVDIVILSQSAAAMAPQQRWVHPGSISPTGLLEDGRPETSQLSEQHR